MLDQQAVECVHDWEFRGKEERREGDWAIVEAVYYCRRCLEEKRVIDHKYDTYVRCALYDSPMFDIP